MALRIEHETPFKDWLQAAMSSLRELSPAPRDIDESEISQKSIDQAAEFLSKLAKEVRADKLQAPYVGAGYNGQVVVGWVNQSNRIDLEFYEDHNSAVAAFYDGSSHELAPEVNKVAEIVRKICKVA
jgi:hypothetical protein